MLRILFVEDDEESIDPVRRLIGQGEIGVDCHAVGFDQAKQVMGALRPDIVVLDLWEGDVSEEKNRGSEHLNFIWDQQFCPVIIHSASPDTPPEHMNSFVREVTKGQNSPQQVLDMIREFRPHVQALKEAEGHIRNLFSVAMRDVGPSTFEFITNDSQRNDAMRRAGRRRLAALMDEGAAGGQELVSWEQYICPPVSKDILLGDLLWKADAEKMDPNSFYVVLTPSCDLVSSEVRQTKVSRVLVANCCSIKEGFGLTSLKALSVSKLKERLISSVLSRGYFETIMPFPALEGRIPAMAANLRDLKLIPLSDIGQEDELFRRMASLDSPFRELVSWAYVQVSGRPGVPDRDLAAWRDEIVTAYAK